MLCGYPKLQRNVSSLKVGHAWQAKERIPHKASLPSQRVYWGSLRDAGVTATASVWWLTKSAQPESHVQPIFHLMYSSTAQDHVQQRQARWTAGIWGPSFSLLLWESASGSTTANLAAIALYLSFCYGWPFTIMIVGSKHHYSLCPVMMVTVHSTKQLFHH